VTLIVASEVPGLQLFDKGTGSWIDVERLLDAKKYIVLMTGKKTLDDFFNIKKGKKFRFLEATQSNQQFTAFG
jgi:hypothetical protein